MQECFDRACLADMELLGEGRFDAAVLNMVIMDMPDIAALAGGLRHILKASVPRLYSQVLRHAAAFCHGVL